MDYLNKGRSPFYPSQPVPIEFFIGRTEQVDRIARALKQVELGKPQSIFLSGEYGIGKSSLAGYMKSFAEKSNNILGIYVLLGGIDKLDDLASKTVEATLKEQIFKENVGEKVKNFLARYIGKQELFGISINLQSLKADSPVISNGFLPFLNELFNRVKSEGINGLFLIFDEINGITKNPSFAHFIKGLVDENALSERPLPLMLMLCGIEVRRMEMIENHKPVERIFDLVDIEPMDDNEMKDFFIKAFSSVDTIIDENALEILCNYSQGFPKIMHIIGDHVFWIDNDHHIEVKDTAQGLIHAAEEIGKKFVDQQVYNALGSKDYRSILEKLAKEDIKFKKKDVEVKLTSTQKKKFHNFLQRMKKLNMLKSFNRGEYLFTNRMVHLYIYLKDAVKENKSNGV